MVGPAAVVSGVANLDVAGALAYVITWGVEIKGAIGGK